VTKDESHEIYDIKAAALERVLGPMADTVLHAPIPFEIGGSMDMYVFPNGIAGTGFATMELIQPDGTGPQPNRIGTYELVAFTKLVWNQGWTGAAEDPFNEFLYRTSRIFDSTGRYSYQAVLNPGETCDVPLDDADASACLILDDYAPDGRSFEIDGRKHCLLLCMEVFRSEMEYAWKHGTKVVLQKLQDAGHYPYGDLDREPVC